MNSYDFDPGDPSTGLHVSWSGVEAPTSDDLITLGCDLYDDPNEFLDALPVINCLSLSIFV